MSIILVFVLRSPPSSRNVLVESPALRDDATAGATDVLDSPGETNLLVVSYRDDPDAWLQRWRTRAESLPAEFGFVRVGETTRSAAATAGGARTARGTLPLVAAVSDPSDLTGLGIRVSEYLERWAGNGNRTVIWFDSVTALLQFVDLDRAYRFLHVLSGRVKSVDGRGYYLLDPSAHDDRTVAILQELADDAVDLADLGSE